MANYYLRRGASVSGPFAVAAIKEACSSGQVLTSDFIADSKNGPWQTIDSFFTIPGQSGITRKGKSTPPPLASSPPPVSGQPALPQAQEPRLEFRSESEYVAVVHGPYDLVYQLMRDSMAHADGAVKTDSPSQGNLLAKWRYGINPFGLSVSAVMRDAGNGWTRVEVTGFFSDAVDTFGHAKKKARLVMSQFEILVEDSSSAIPHASQAFPVDSRPGPAAPSMHSAGSGKSYSGMATASLICGIGGLLICGVAGFVGLILGVVALSGMSSSGNDAGRGSAIAGIALGGVAIFAWSLIVLANL